ncbi:MAG: hypothetical protein HKN44_04885, partial [Ilumatobacter sp.]|nr:hypothetical protein [Ilumatobacter sp.]
AVADAPTRDADRTAVGAAELAAFDGTDLEERIPFDIVAARIARVVDGSWWPAGEVRVERARADAGSSTTRCAGDGRAGSPDVRIRLASPQWTVATAAHELAHVLAGVARGHDAVFRRAYLDVVAVITNIDSIDRRRDLHPRQLADAFAAAGLAVAPRAWPAPPASTGTPFAL